MHNAIVHIGTEKTGSTTIQNFLYKNEKALALHGYYFPYRTCGLISNFRLAIYACEQADPQLLAMERKPVTDDPNAAYEVSPEAWRQAFTDFHLEQIKKIHNKHRHTTVVYSSEHFHSRIRHESEVKRLQDFLDQYYDKVTIIVYVRRQDRLAVSGHNTAIQGGNTNRFYFPENLEDTNYYDYLSLVTRWSNVFGKENITVRVFEKDRLIGGDVAKDFQANVLSANVQKKLKQADLHYERSNPRLSHSALETLLEFNRLPEDDPLLKGANKAEIRQAVITALHTIKDEYGEVLPPRRDAMRYYESFRNDNQMLFDNWADGQSFGDDFTMYPDEASAAPEVNTQALLSQCLPAGS